MTAMKVPHILSICRRWGLGEECSRTANIGNAAWKKEGWHESFCVKYYIDMIRQLLLALNLLIT
jgi:hypothetical protein